MNLRILFAASLLTVSTAALAEDHFERTLNVSAQPDLYVSTGSGNITVHEGSGNQIHIVGHIHAGWSAFGNIDGRITKIVQSPPIVQEGNTVRVGENVSHDLYENITIDYEITAPSAVALNLHSGSGDVTAEGLGRYISASSGSGNVRAHGVSGPAELQSGSGDIELTELSAGDVKARTGSGNVHIHGLNGGLIARSGSGDIDADGHLNGSASLESGSGKRGTPPRLRRPLQPRSLYRLRRHPRQLPQRSAPGRPLPPPPHRPGQRRWPTAGNSHRLRRCRDQWLARSFFLAVDSSRRHTLEYVARVTDGSVVTTTFGRACAGH